MSSKKIKLVYKGAEKFSLSKALMCFVGITSFAVLLRNSEIAIGYMKYGLKVCAGAVVPSLFPFMVLSSLFVEFGFSELLGKILKRPIGFLLGISGAGSSVPIMGALCGFPLGAVTARRLYERGEISQKEFERLLTFSNNPSSAFLISVAGSALWSCRAFGLALYIIQLLSSLLIGIFLNIFFPLERSKCDSKKIPQKKNEEKGVRIFTRVVSESALSMLYVCAFVVFFTSIVGALSNMLEYFGIGQTAKTLIFGFFEMTGAVSEASKIASVETGLLVTALCVGWSGLSVHFQIMAMCGNEKLRFRPYFVAKLIQGGLSAVMMFVYMHFINRGLLEMCVPAFTDAALSASINIAHGFGKMFLVISNMLFGVGILGAGYLKKRNNGM